MRTPVRLAVAAALLPPVGRQAWQGPERTDAGAESGVAVAWRPADFPVGARPRPCADGECREHAAPPAEDPLALLDAPLPGGDGVREVAPRSSVADPAGGGRAVREFSGRFALRGVAPNGEGCGPTARRADVRADPRAGRCPAADPARPYGTQWLPETVIITWSWMLAEK
ncbi:hypothetical protein [Streptomyces sp. NPDC014656]|uniref:hypothetical protein n=1 Tax=Streptomyces sp. NPDC014656 TaxID=3364878 RepID=UPI0036F737AE